jgi:hypothetical protein
MTGGWSHWLGSGGVTHKGVAPLALKVAEAFARPASEHVRRSEPA